jgi:hypothetical protein
MVSTQLFDKYSIDHGRHLHPTQDHNSMSDATSKSVDSKGCKKEHDQISQNITASAETALRDKQIN